MVPAVPSQGKSYDLTLSGTMCAPTTGRTKIPSLDSQLMVPFLPRGTFSCTLVLVVGGFPWDPPHLRNCVVGASPSDDDAPLSGMSFHAVLRTEDAGLPVSSSVTQL